MTEQGQTTQIETRTFSLDMTFLVIYPYTDHESEIIEEEGYTIQVIPVWEWLTKDTF